MTITMRTYSGEPLFCEDYFRVREFLVECNRGRLDSPNFNWARWEWMIGHGMLDPSALDRIGLWEEDGRIVAMATYESTLGEAYFCLDSRYPQLKEPMLDYALKRLSKDGALQAAIPDGDREWQRLAFARGLRASQRQDHVAAIDIDDSLDVSLPQGFSIVSMADGWDYEKYHRVMWRGFNHEGPPPTDRKSLDVRRQMLSGPGVNPDIVLAVVAPDGEYASHCGMWYMPGDDFANIEPVATDSTYRRMGLGKAVVLEGVRRCGKLGAKQAMVGSSQPFYYRIGFAPIYTATFWMAPE